MLPKVCNTEHYFHEKFSLEKFPWSNKFRILYYFFQKKKKNTGILKALDNWCSNKNFLTPLTTKIFHIYTTIKIHRIHSTSLIPFGKHCFKNIKAKLMIFPMKKYV